MAYKNKADYNRWFRNFRRRNKAYCDAIATASIAKNPIHYRKKWRRPADRLTDYYIRQQLSQKNKVPRAAWPCWLVNLKRISIQLKRKYGIHQKDR